MFGSLYRFYKTVDNNLHIFSKFLEKFEKIQNLIF